MRVKISCFQCHIEFERSASRQKQHNFCSITCLTQARKKGGVIYARRKCFQEHLNCLTCGIEFVVMAAQRQKKYCSRRCAGIQRRSGGLIANKVDETTLKHHGVRRILQSEVGREKLKHTLQERYGVDYALQIPGLASIVWRKCHETMKKRGSYKGSRVEDSLANDLSEWGVIFTRQELVEKRPIDFWFPELRTYLQIDGVYWHALDRPIEEIAELTSRRDRSRYSKWVNDRKQDLLFEQKGLRLVRLTDRELKQWRKQGKQIFKERVILAISQMS